MPRAWRPGVGEGERDGRLWSRADATVALSGEGIEPGNLTGAPDDVLKLSPACTWKRGGRPRAVA